jgi:hypothetical protein
VQHVALPPGRAGYAEVQHNGAPGETCPIRSVRIRPGGLIVDGPPHIGSRADTTLFLEDYLMMLRRLVLLTAILAMVPACGNSPTAPALDASALTAEESATKPVTVRTTTTTTTTSTTTGDESDSPKDGQARGGGFLGSGS